MCSKQKRRFGLFLFAALIVFLGSSVSLGGPATEPQKVVLALYGSRPDLPANIIVDEIIRSTLEHELGPRLDFYAEYLDTARWPEAETQSAIHDFLQRRYAHKKPSVIIAVAQPAINFIHLYGDDLFPGVPIVVYGPVDALRDWKPGRSITGTLAKLDLSGTAELILRLQPNTREILVISGASPSDQWLQSIARQQLEELEKRVKFTYLTGVGVDDLERTVTQAADGTAVLFLSMLQDSAGNRLLSHEVFERIAKAARVPVFSHSGLLIGEGSVGGVVFNPDSLGRETAQLTLKLLQGKRIEDLPVQESKSSVPMVDWRQMQRWGLDEKRLPAGTVTRFREPSPWQTYRWYIGGGLCLLFLQTSLILGLLWQRTIRRKAEAEVMVRNRELAVMNDRLRLAVEAGKAVGWDLDMKSGNNRWFGDLQTVFGIASENLSGNLDFYGRVHPEDRQFVWKAVADSQQSHKPYLAEFRVIQDGGMVRWLAARGEFFYGTNGVAERMLGMSVDITDRKLAEEVRHRHAAIVESSSDAIISTSLTHVILTWNVGAERLFGYKEAEAIGKLVEILLPADRGDEESCLLEKLRNGEPIEQYETTRITKAGMGIEVSLTISAIKDGSGQVVGYAEILRDITERRRAQSVLRESEQRFRLLANTAPVMIWTTGTDKLCDYVNKTWLDFTGRTLKQDLGNGWAESIHSQDVDNCLRVYTEAFDRREQFEIEYRLRRHDGAYRWVYDKGVPRFHADGSFAGYIGSCIDVTERKRAEEALATVGRRLIEAHEEERTRIGRELHDDVNQRLALLAVELDQWMNDTSRANFSEHLRRAQGRIAELSRDVQALSHRLHSSKLDYLGLATAARSFCREISQTAKIEVQFEQSAIPSTIPNDVSLCLYRVLQEALQNAIKYSGVKTFKVHLRGTFDGIELAVSDNGQGFDDREAFSREGLGLISMRERLQMVHGTLEIKTQRGGGTTIFARAPLETAQLRAKAG